MKICKRTLLAYIFRLYFFVSVNVRNVSSKIRGNGRLKTSTKNVKRGDKRVLDLDIFFLIFQ